MSINRLLTVVTIFALINVGCLHVQSHNDALCNDEEENCSEISDGVAAYFALQLLSSAINHTGDNYTPPLTDDGTPDPSSGTDGSTTPLDGALLDNIALNGGILQPYFSSNRFFYEVDYPRDATFIQLTLTPRESAAALEINGTPVYEGETYSIPLIYDVEYIEISVTNAVGDITLTYIVKVTRPNGL